MRRGADYHIHTKLCRHASGEMEAYVREALTMGLGEIGFADHAPAVEGYDPAHRMALAEFPKYVEKTRKLRDEVKEIEIRLGIETDFYPGFEPFLERLLKSFPVDYVIGSVHFIDGFSVYIRDQQDLSREEERNYIQRYFEIVENGVRSGLVDVVGHLDLVKWTFPDAREEIRVAGCDVLRVIAEEGLVLEVNTSGLRKLPCEVYPSPDLLRVAHTLNIPVCLGSDAHRPEEVGANFGDAMVLLEEVGYCREAVSKDGLKVLLPEQREAEPSVGTSDSVFSEWGISRKS